MVRPRIGPALQFWSIQGFEFNRITLALRDLPDALVGTRILHLADLHLRSTWPRGLGDLIPIVQKNPPHVILFGVDEAHNMHHVEPSYPQIKRLIRELPSQYKFSVLGNHDNDIIVPKLREWGAPVIAHRLVEVKINDHSLEIIGYPGPERADIQLEFGRAYPPKRADVPRIIVSHYPDLIHFGQKLKPDLYLAGHTHGGQICLPGGYPILRHDTLPRRFCKGLNNYNDICMFVSRGMGFSSPLQVRLFCPCEAVEIELVSLVR